MPDSQRYPWNLYLVKNVEDNVVFLGLKVFNSFKNFILSAVYINTYGLYKRNELLENARMRVVNSYWTNININSSSMVSLSVFLTFLFGLQEGFKVMKSSK